MTFPTLFDTLATNVLAGEPLPENPRHRMLLDTFIEIQRLDQQLTDLISSDLPAGDSAANTLEHLTDLLTDRLLAGYELAQLLSVACCCAEDEDSNDTEDTEDDDDFLSCPGQCRQPESIVHACLEVFAAIGDPDAMASADLVTCLRDLPGVAEGRWRQARLAQLLAPYEVSTRDVTLPDKRRRKSYRRGALLAALPGHSG
ncbi:MAG: DUF3631 domain-containing protein [Streptomycetaceae bacterium]|nr:DUF3631 domain-containing protein [Streptomycetaceae bacterium]